MNKETIIAPRHVLLDLLALDSIYQKLTWFERTTIHLILNDKTDRQLTENAESLLYLMVLNNWRKPFTKYPEWQKDVLHYETPEGDWEPVEHYRLNNQHLTLQINQIKN